MIAIASVEARRAATSILLWMGVVAVVGLDYASSKDYWPVIPGDVARAYEMLLAIGACAFLTGAWGGLRDKRHGMMALVAATPGGLRRALVGRSAGIAATSGALTVLTLVAVAGVSFIRGGRGAIEIGFLVDAAGFGAAFAAAGFAVGTITGSRIASLLGTPAVAIAVFWLEGRLKVPIMDGLWLLPHVTPPQWYGPLGYLPDVWLIHGVYLLGLATAISSGVVLYMAARHGGGDGMRWVRLVTAISVVVAIGGAGWLVNQPESVVVVGSSVRDVFAEDGSDDVYERARRQHRTEAVLGPDGGATACSTVDGFEACVYPEYGERYAEDLARGLSLLTPLRSLEGVPTRAVMIPSYYNPCFADYYLVPAQTSQSMDPDASRWNSDEAFSCALGQRRWNNTKDAISIWVSIAVTGSQDENDRYYNRRREPPAHIEVAAQLARMPTTRVVELLEPIWPDMQRGEISIGELRALIR